MNENETHTTDPQVVIKREESANSGDVTVHTAGDNKTKVVTKELEEQASNHQKVQTQEPAGRHRRVASNTSLKTQGSKKSLIGTAYRLSHSGGWQAVITTIETGKPPSTLNLGDPVVGDNEDGEATWNDVYRACCVHTFQEWIRIGMSGFSIPPPLHLPHRS